MSCLKIRPHQVPETQRRPYKPRCLLLQSPFTADIFSAIYITYLQQQKGITISHNVEMAHEVLCKYTICSY